jgi:hypothetical protein
MSYRIAISFAAAAIGISCIATDVSAKGGGGSRGGGGGKILAPAGFGGAAAPKGATGGGAAGGAPYYAPASYNSNTACGRYPYPPCKKVPTR